MVWARNDNDIKIRTLKLLEYFWNYNLRKTDSDNDDDSDDNDDDDEGKDDDNDANNNKKLASAEIMVSALDAWIFLITSIGSSSGIGLLLDTYCNTLFSLLRLESTSVNEKIHIGKALTVLIDNYNTAIENDSDFIKQVKYIFLCF